LGLDPSINFLGYSMFYGAKLASYGVHKTWRGYVTPPDRQRLKSILRLVGNVCDSFSPEVVVIEDWQWRFSDTKMNKDVLKKLIWAIGICLVGVPESAEVVTFRPHQWKAGKKKEDVINMAKRQFGIKEKLNHNAADAIMLGWHYIQVDSQERLEV
jgi:Holliday junction resolvasome RuvABC endonuclease subunit